MREVVAATGAQSRVMTSAGALVHGLEAIGAKNVSLLAPYMKPLTAKVVDYLEHQGIEVLDRISFEIPDNLAVGRRDPMQLLEDVKRLNIANADAVVLSTCVQMPSLLAIARAQAQLGLPVTSTTACTVRNMLDLLGLSRRFPTAARSWGQRLQREVLQPNLEASVGSLLPSTGRNRPVCRALHNGHNRSFG